jgi:hypothetical protein
MNWDARNHRSLMHTHALAGPFGKSTLPRREGGQAGMAQLFVHTFRVIDIAIRDYYDGAFWAIALEVKDGKLFVVF